MSNLSVNLTRRSLTGAAAVTAGFSAAGLVGCATGLKPSADTPPSQSPAPIVTTGVVPAAAPKVEGPLTSIALLSCIDQHKPMPLLDTVRLAKPSLVLFGGDNVYANQVPFALSNLDEAYRTLASNPSFQRLRVAAPHMVMWDDNDYGLNDGGGDFAAKRDSKSYFLGFWQAQADDPRRQRDGVYYARTFGPIGQRVQVIMLDVRFNRSAWRRTDQWNAPGKERYVPDADTSKTMLGEAQWLWLEAQLREPAELRFIVSGIQVLAEGHGWERWGLFPHERARLLGLIGRTSANGVVLMSGDRHIGALYRDTFNAPYTMTELTSSGVTHVWETASEAGPNRMGDLVRVLHFGWAEIDWVKRSVSLQNRDMNNQVLQSIELGFDTLRPGAQATPVTPRLPIK